MNMQSEPDRTEVYLLDSEANGTILIEESTKLATLLPLCALTWTFRQKPGCRKPTFKSVFYLDMVPSWPQFYKGQYLGGSAFWFQRRKIICLTFLPLAMFWWEGRQRTWTYPSPRLWSRGLSQQGSMLAMRTELCPAVPPHLRQPWVRTAEALPLRAEAEHIELLSEPHPQVLHENALPRRHLLAF